MRGENIMPIDLALQIINLFLRIAVEDQAKNIFNDERDDDDNDKIPNDTETFGLLQAAKSPVRTRPRLKVCRARGLVEHHFVSDLPDLLHFNLNDVAIFEEARRI